MHFRYLGNSGFKISEITYGNWLTHGSQLENDHGIVVVDHNQGVDMVTASMLLDLRDLGRHSIALIRQNYGMSIAVNALGLVIGAGGALSPVLAAVLHNASSVAVVLNSSRLIRYQVEPAPSASAEEVRA